MKQKTINDYVLMQKKEIDRIIEHYKNKREKLLDRYPEEIYGCRAEELFDWKKKDTDIQKARYLYEALLELKDILNERNNDGNSED